VIFTNGSFFFHVFGQPSALFDVVRVQCDDSLPSAAYSAGTCRFFLIRTSRYDDVFLETLQHDPPVLFRYYSPVAWCRRISSLLRESRSPLLNCLLWLDVLEAVCGICWIGRSPNSVRPLKIFLPFLVPPTLAHSQRTRTIS